MAYDFHDTNVNTQEQPLFNVYRYIKHADPYTYNYMIRHEQECVDNVKICGLEDDNNFAQILENPVTAFKFQYSVDYNLVAFNKDIADLFNGDVIGDCPTMIIINKINNSFSQEACEEYSDFEIQLLMDLFDVYCSCDLCGYSFRDFYIGDLSNIIINKNYKRVKFDSGVYNYSYQKNVILPESKYVELYGKFIDSVSVDCSFSMSDQVTINFNVHSLEIETIYNEDVTFGDLSVASC